MQSRGGTTIEKINKIVETIKTECPNGCSGLSCSECPLNDPDNAFGYEICEMLSRIELLLPHENLLREPRARINKRNVPHPTPHSIKGYTDTIEQQPSQPMESSIIHAVQTAHDKLKKGK